MSRTVRDRAKRKSLTASRRLRQQAARNNNEAIVVQRITGASRARDVTHTRVTRRVPR